MHAQLTRWSACGEPLGKGGLSPGVSTSHVNTDRTAFCKHNDLSTSSVGEILHEYAYSNRSFSIVQRYGY